MRLLAGSAGVLSLALGLSIGSAKAVDVSVEAGVSLNVNAGVELNIGYFHEQLAPHGTWVEVAEYGRVWQPSVAVNTEWRPYMDEGHWIWTDQGWYWNSTYKWGWAAFHYGRWNYVDKYNWVWSPDTTWAPAWVSWRQSDSVYGWAPLSHGSRFEAGVFIGGGIELRAEAYNFVPAQSFLSINLGSVAVPRARRTTVYNETKIINNTYVYNDNRVINNGIPVTQVAVATRQEIKAAPIADAKVSDEKPAPGKVAAFRPAIKNEQPKTPPATPAAKPDATPAKVETAAKPETPAAKPDTAVKPAPKPDVAPDKADPAKPAKVEDPKSEPAKPKVDAKPDTDPKTPAAKPDVAPVRPERVKSDTKKEEDPKSEPAKPKVDAKPETDTRKPEPNADVAPERPSLKPETKKVNVEEPKSKPAKPKADSKPDAAERTPAPKPDAAPKKREANKPDEPKVNQNEPKPNQQNPKDEPPAKPARSNNKDSKPDNK
jgi:hypothetical protein